MWWSIRRWIGIGVPFASTRSTSIAVRYASSEGLGMSSVKLSCFTW